MLLKLERLMLTLTVMDVKTTLAQDCKHFNCTFSLHVIHPKLLKRNIYNWIYVFGLHKWNIYTDSICTSANTRRFSPVAVRLIKQSLGFSKVPCSFHTSYDARPGIVRCLNGRRWNRTIWISNQTRHVPVRCVQTPAGHRTPIFWALRTI